jgi:hypothetical protein
MANSDKNIVITPNIGSTTSQPNIVFTGQNASPITLRVTDDGVVSWEGSAGQLFSITNSLSGTLFSVNDASGLPLLEVTDAPSIIAYAPIVGAAGATYLNDVSNLCDGVTQVFTLRYDQTALSTTATSAVGNSYYIVDSKDLEVTVNGRELPAFITPLTYPWITVTDPHRGFRVRENRLIIFNAPESGSEVFLILKKTSATKQKRKYPFSALTIGLGD